MIRLVVGWAPIGLASSYAALPAVRPVHARGRRDVDEGRVDGDTVRFYINHIDTPPNAARREIQRNVMTGTLPAPDNGNVMKFTWVAEPSPTQTGEIVMIGPIR